MPFINIKLVPENGGPTNEQKRQLIEGGFRSDGEGVKQK